MVSKPMQDPIIIHSDCGNIGDDVDSNWVLIRCASIGNPVRFFFKHL